MPNPETSFFHEEMERQEGERRTEKKELRKKIDMLFNRLNNTENPLTVENLESLTAKQLERYILAAPLVRNEQEIWNELTPEQQQVVEKLITESASGEVPEEDAE